MWSMPLNVVFTAVFVVTGAYSLVRWAGLRAGTVRHGDHLAELSHLVMSLAMVAMVWDYGGAAATVLQVVVFGGFAVYFATRLRRGGPRASPVCHLLMCVAMAWMVATMPALMSGSGGARGGAVAMDMPGMVMSSGDDTLFAGPAPAWMAVLTVVFAVAMVGAAAVWLRGAVTAGATTGATAGAATGAANGDATGAATGTATGDATGAVIGAATGAATGTANGTVGAATGAVLGTAVCVPRVAACCHVLMALGMALMLLLTV